MKRWIGRVAVVLGVSGGWAAAEDTCLMYVANNIAKGSGNLYIYHVFSEQAVELKAGDVLAYDVFLHPKQPSPIGGIELLFTDKDYLRDSGAKDQNGIGSHGGNALPDAVGKWYHREFPLDVRAGRTVAKWDLQCEGDAAGLYIQFIDNVLVKRADGSTVAIYENGPPPVDRIDWKEGYSQKTYLQAVPRAKVVAGKALDDLVDAEIRDLIIEGLSGAFQAELDRLKEFLSNAGESAVLPVVEEARQAAPRAEGFRGTVAEFQAAILEARKRLAHAHPVMMKYTGHLIGHAHIDLQWLWEWSETVNVCRDTFGQAVKFMEEYPGFTFNQSSPCLYQVTKEHHPALFEKIREYVKKGQWEVAGGRWCEADTHMPSDESQARHFLLGQRWFRENLGTVAQVGWEPDTFGHAWQMPQLLNLAGIRDYYFCRGGKVDPAQPLYWWEGLDGSRVLAFEETATGTWYNADIGPKQVQEVLDFRRNTGSFHSLWVYGVGNHGGGPTRENILTALDWMKDPLRPTVTFSTATAWFRKVREETDLKNLPVVREELNHERPGINQFFGTYTTHGNVKRWNRDAEALTVQAETAAVIAGRTGFPYPRETFRRSWRDILWNHHHDTLTGTSIHPSYYLTEQVFERAIAASRSTLVGAAEHLAARVKLPDALAAQARPAGAGRACLVLNTLAWRRDALVEIENDEDFYPPGGLVAVAPDGATTPVQFSGERWFLFVAKALPADGWRAYVIRPRRDDEPAPPGTNAVDGGKRLGGGRYEVTVDPAKGTVTKLTDAKLKRDWIVPENPGNRLVAWLEKPHGMSAWIIGEFEKAEEPEDARELRVIEKGPVRARVQLERRYRQSTIRQDIMVYRDLDRVDFALDVEWHEKGGGGKPSPFLKAEFPLNVPGGQPRYEIPFGDVARPQQEREVPALQWADLGGADGGVALLNDCKYGHSCSGDVLRLSLIRSSYEPDPEPDLGRHVIRYALYPHAGGLHEGGVVKQGYEYNHRVVAAWLPWASDEVRTAAAPATASGARAGALPVSLAGGEPGAVARTLPAEKSCLEVSGEGVIPTALKLSEDPSTSLGAGGSEWIVRFYQSGGRPATAKIAVDGKVASAEVVNLIEDPTGEKVNVDAVPLKGYEIKTVKLKVE